MNRRSPPFAAISILSTAFAGCLHSTPAPTPYVLSDSGVDAPPPGDASHLDGAPADAGAFDSGGEPDATLPGDSGAPDGRADGASASARGIYVSNGNGSVVVLPLDAVGDAGPLRVITGADAGLSLPIGVAVDSNGNLYVANRSGSAVTVYSSSATGNAAPIRTLTSQGMNSPEGVAIGSGGDVYVSTCPGCGSSAGGNSGVYHFPAGASTSDRVIGGATNVNTLLTYPGSIGVDSLGDVFVGNSFSGVLEMFAPDASGDIAPVASYGSPAGNLQSIAYGGHTVFVAIPSVGIAEYLATSPADASVSSTISTTSLPVSYPGGMFVDDRGPTPVLYVVDYSKSALYVVQTTGAAGAWAVGSFTTIAGPATGLSSPLGVAVSF